MGKYCGGAGHDERGIIVRWERNRDQERRERERERDRAAGGSAVGDHYLIRSAVSEMEPLINIIYDVNSAARYRFREVPS